VIEHAIYQFMEVFGVGWQEASSTPYSVICRMLSHHAVSIDVQRSLQEAAARG
jgi:hypothetical protein